MVGDQWISDGERRRGGSALAGPGGPIDASAVNQARRYNYWLGGSDHFPADKASGDEIAAAFPGIRTTALENRKFLRRATAYLARQGIHQFLDIGTGLPTAENTHEVAQGITPEARVVYVDNDPSVIAYARRLLQSTPSGRAVYLEADLREPEKILSSAGLQDTLDLARPVGLMLVAVLHFVRDDEEAISIVHRLLDALPAGSYLVATNPTKDFAPPALAASYDRLLAAGRSDAWPRDYATFSRFFDGLEIASPGIVPVCDWRSETEPEPRPEPVDASMYAAVARILRA
jgi:SAM-dependent methyltransferase